MEFIYAKMENICNILLMIIFLKDDEIQMNQQEEDLKINLYSFTR